MNKRLDVVYPSITTYTHHAHLFSILGNNEATKDWIYSNYIQFFINKDLESNCWGDFYFPMPYETRLYDCCKWLNCQKFNKGFVKETFDSVVDFVKQQIDKNRYVTCCVDFKEITSSFISYNYMHDLLVYGYDDEKQVLLCADFLFERNTKYGFYECSYDDFGRAYSNDFMNHRVDYLNDLVYTLELKESCDYEYSVKNLIYWLKEYKESAMPEYWKGFNFCNSKNIVWGLDYYLVLADYFSNRRVARSELMVFYLLQDHASLMCERIAFLNQRGNLDEFINEYHEITGDIKKLVFWALRLTVKDDNTASKAIAEGLLDIRKREYDVLGRLIQNLEQQEVTCD